MALVIVLLFAMALYFAPTLVALNRKNAAGVVVLNVFLGWTLIGWVVALAWAVSLPRPAPASSVSRLVLSVKPIPEHLAWMRESGPRLLVHKDGDKWQFDAERGTVATVAGDDARKISFRAGTQGAPRAQIYDYRPDGTVLLVVDFGSVGEVAIPTIERGEWVM